jgi:hypothetical protein
VLSGWRRLLQGGAELQPATEAQPAFSGREPA